MCCKHGSKSLDDGIALSGAHDSNFDKSGEVINYHQVLLTLMLAEVEGNLVPGQFGKGAGLERFSRVGADGTTRSARIGSARITVDRRQSIKQLVVNGHTYMSCRILYSYN